MTRLLRAVLVLALLCAPAAWAANTTILNGDSGLSVRNKLNTLLNQQFYVEQPPYSTAGSQYLQIQNAVNDACANGSGGIVLLGQGTYNIGSNSINFDRCARSTLVTGTTAGTPGVITVLDSSAWGPAGTVNTNTFIQNVSSEANCFPCSGVTVVDATHISVNGVTFVNTLTGLFGTTNDFTFKPGIWLQGNGLNQGFGRSTIQCSIAGFCVDKHVGVRSTGAVFGSGLTILDGMQISNTLTDSRGVNDIGAGALRFEGLTAGEHISNCQVSGGVGIIAFQGSFSGDISHCQFNGGGSYSGSVGFYIGQISATDLRAVSCGTCILAGGAATLTNISTESSGTGVAVGLTQPNTFQAFIDNGAGLGTYNNTSGNVITVKNYIYGSFDADDGSGAGGHGKGIVTYKMAASAPATWASGYTTTGILTYSIALYPTGQTAIFNQEGAGIAMATPASTGAVYSAGSGGTITYTLASSSGITGQRNCYADGFTGGDPSAVPPVAGYNFRGSFSQGVICNYSGATVTITGTDNGITIPNPGVANSGNGTIFRHATQACTTSGFAPSGYNLTSANCRFFGNTVTIEGADNSTTYSNPGTNTTWNLGQGLLGFGAGGGPDPTEGTMSICTGCTAGAHFVAQLTTTQAHGVIGAEGTYVLDTASNVSLETMQTGQGGRIATGASLRGWQTERLNTALAVYAASAATFSNMEVTGSLGAGISATAASFTTGTFTFTLRWDPGSPGVRTCFTEDFDTGYNFNQLTGFGGGVSCTWIASSLGVPAKVTITGQAAPSGGTSGQLGKVSPAQSGCVYFGGQVTSTTVSNISCGIGAPKDLLFTDFSGADGSAGWVVLDNMKIINGITLPPTNTRACVSARNSRGVGPVDFQVAYANLPNVGAGPCPSTVEGDEILIIDAAAGNCTNPVLSGGTTFTNSCVIGALVTGGGGTLHRKVRWNGSNWVVVGY